MAKLAVVAVEGGMTVHEDGIGRLVACPAVDLGGFIHTLEMAIFTKNRAVIEVSLMPSQTEVGQPVMIKFLKVISDGNGFAPFMLGMATAAFFRIGQATVHAIPGEALLTDTGMATLTALGRAALPGRVAFGAVCFKIGMGVDAR